MPSIVLDYDDFHWKSPENCLSFIYNMIKFIPNIKITLFTVPFHSGLPLFENQAWCGEVKRLIDSGNIELAVHGYTHMPNDEFKHYNFEQTLTSIMAAEEIFKISGLSFIKAFKGPGWGINENTIKSLLELKYEFLFINEYTHKIIDNGNIKIIQYNWNLKDPFNNDLLSQPTIFAHGHTFDVCENGIEQTFDKIYEMYNELKNNITFSFVEELS